MTVVFTEDVLEAMRAEMRIPSRAHETYALEMREAQTLPAPRSGARGRFFITPHAVRRYIERVRPGISYHRALGELVIITSAGKRVGPTHDGRGEMWRGPKIGTKAKQDRRSRLRFVVSRGEPGELPQVVTVLAPREKRC